MAPLRSRQPPNLGPLASVAARGLVTAAWTGRREAVCQNDASVGKTTPQGHKGGPRGIGGTSQIPPTRAPPPLAYGTPPSSLVTAAWMGRRGLGVAFARSEPALRCRVVTGREGTPSVTLESVGAVQISKTTPPRWPLQNTAHILQGWGRRTPNWAMRAPWRLTERRIASGHAPRAQNCPRSRLGRSECLRRPLGAANAAWSVGAAGAKNRKL